MATEAEGGALDRRGFRVRAPGEITIHCADLAPMAAFFGHVIGVEQLPGGHGDGTSCFRDAPSRGRHTTVLAVFAPTAPQIHIHPAGPPRPCAGAASSLHHIPRVVPAGDKATVAA
ncbi:MAG: hypothetical protein AAF899_16125 [Pseudomonadota bacterium]